MSTKSTEEVIERLADHRLEWDRIENRIEHALVNEQPLVQPAQHLGPYIAVSRSAGAGAAIFAKRLGETLQWPVLGSEIVDLVAETFQLDGAMIHLLDDAKANWVRDVLGDLMPHQVINLDTYVHHLSRVMRLIALHGNVILLGRGAQFLLPGDRGIAVRLVASIEERVGRISATENIDHAAARRRIDDIDHRRAHFAQHYFGRDVDDPTLYDLVLNRSKMTDDELVDTVLTLSRRRGYDS
jgi:cytidylate kinase